MLNAHVRVVAALAVAFMLGAGFDAQQAGAAEEAAEPQASGADDYQLRFAQTRVKYFELALRIAEERNQRLPNVIPAATIDDYRTRLEAGRALLEATEKGRGDDFGVYVAVAQAASKEALNKFQRAQATRERAPDTYTAAQVELLGLEAQMAKINYEYGQSIMGASTDTQTQWKIFFLFKEVIRLRGEVTRLSYNIGN